MLGIDVDVVHALSLRFIVDCQVTERTQKRARHPSFYSCEEKNNTAKSTSSWGIDQHLGDHPSQEIVEWVKVYPYHGFITVWIAGIHAFEVWPHTYAPSSFSWLDVKTCIQCYALQVLSYSYPLSLLANMATSNLGLSHPRKKNTFLSTDFFCSQDLLRFSYALCAAFDGVATLLRGLSAPSA